MVVANMWQKKKKREKLGRCCQTAGGPAVNLKQPHEAVGRKAKGGGKKIFFLQKQRVRWYNLLAYQPKPQFNM